MKRLVTEYKVQVSTVLLPFGLRPIYETYLFYSHGGSEVVDSYFTEEEAKAGHERWCNAMKYKGKV